jgi:hypothetical protein
MQNTAASVAEDGLLFVIAPAGEPFSVIVRHAELSLRNSSGLVDAPDRRLVGANTENPH